MKKNKIKLNEGFETLASADKTNMRPITNINKPSDIAIQEAKEWVEENKK